MGSANLSRFAMEETSRVLALTHDLWDRHDLKQLDVSCVLLGRFVDAFCKVYERPWWEGESTPWKTFDGPTWECNGFTLQAAIQLADECFAAAEAAGLRPEFALPRNNHVAWLRPKLYVLKALLKLLRDGTIVQARKMFEQAGDTIQSFTVKSDAIVDDSFVNVPAEIGIAFLLRSELAMRELPIDMSSVHHNGTTQTVTLDTQLMSQLETLSLYYPNMIATSHLERDSIMILPAHAASSERDAYTTVLMALGNFFLSFPRKGGVFPAGCSFTMSPLLTVGDGATMQYRGGPTSPMEMSLPLARKRSADFLQRGLKLHRLLFEHDPNNFKAGWLLVTLACLYADGRDFLSATGLFNKANTAIVENYGSNSEEFLRFLRLELAFLRGANSREAEARQRHINQILALQAQYRTRT